VLVALVKLVQAAAGREAEYCSVPGPGQVIFIILLDWMMKSGPSRGGEIAHWQKNFAAAMQTDSRPFAVAAKGNWEAQFCQKSWWRIWQSRLILGIGWFKLLIFCKQNEHKYYFR